jgi:TonB family protein
VRIGIVHNARIVEERLLRRGESLTVGPSAGDGVVLPHWPRARRLLEARGAGYRLHFSDQMQGRVALGGAVLELGGLERRGLAQAEGGGHWIDLPTTARGKVVVEDVTVLFQFVDAPVVQRVQLPPALRGGFARGWDWPYVASLAGSTVGQVFLMAFMMLQDRPAVPEGLEALPDRFVETVLMQPTPDRETVSPEVTVAQPELPAVPQAPDAPEVQPKVRRVTTPKAVAGGPAATRAAAGARIKRETIIGVIGSNGGVGAGTLVDELGGGISTRQMDRAFEGTTTVAMAEPAPVARGPRTVVGAVVGIGPVKVAKGGGPVRTGRKGDEVRVHGVVAVKAPSEVLGVGSLDMAAISKVVGRRKGAIKSCYERQLKRNPKLGGTVKVAWTIEQSGRTSGVRVVADSTGSAALGQCVRSQIKRWRFPQPDGGSVMVRYPFVFTPTT